jgi:hypothetical protein
MAAVDFAATGVLPERLHLLSPEDCWFDWSADRYQPFDIDGIANDGTGRKFTGAVPVHIVKPEMRF